MSTNSDSDDYMLYTSNEYFDMLMCVAQSKEVISAARIRYQETFPKRPVPPEKHFKTLMHRLRTTGSFHPPLSEPTRLRSGRIRAQVQNDESFEQEPRQRRPIDPIRLKQIRNRVRRADFKEYVEENKPFNKLEGCPNFSKPGLFTAAMNQFPSDCEDRVQFCQWYLDQVKENPRFAQRVLWSDEAIFSRNSIENEEYWLCDRSKSSNQQNWEIRVWAGIIDTKIIGPVFLPINEEENYLDIILKAVEDTLEKLPLTDYKEVVFQHGNVPARFLYSWKDSLDKRFPVWIGDGGPVAWPLCSLDLTPVDYFIWSHIKTHMFSKFCKSEKQMRQKIISTFDDMRKSPDLPRITKSVHRHAKLCLDRNGHDFYFLL